MRWMILIALAACGSDAPREDLRARCAMAFQHAYDNESGCTDGAGIAVAPQRCDRPDCTAFCESPRLNDPDAWLGSAANGRTIDCYEQQRAWIACNESVPTARAPASGCDCSAEYDAVIACAPTGP